MTFRFHILSALALFCLVSCSREEGPSTYAVKVVKTNGTELCLSGGSSHFHSVTIPADSNPYELKFVYKEDEYGFVTRSGNGGIGLVTTEKAALPYRNLSSLSFQVPFAGYSVSKSCGTLQRLADGGNLLWVKTDKPVKVILDDSHSDLRYRIEEVSDNTGGLYAEDFTMLSLGGDYRLNIGGSDVAPGIAISAATGYEAASGNCETLETGYGDAIINWGTAADNASAEYIASRNLENWTLNRVFERPLSLQIGNSEGSGYALSPQIAQGASTGDFTVNLELSRFGTAKENSGMEIEIVGSGSFDADACFVSRDKYYHSKYWDAVIDESIKGAEDITIESKIIKISQQSDGSFFPRGYLKSTVPKPHSHLKLGIRGADSSTRIRLAGESGKNSSFSLHNFKVAKGVSKIINGTVIDASTHYAGVVMDSETGAGIPGVYVNDGAHSVATDANGVYQLAGDGQTRCIWFTLPAAYKLSLDSNNQPLFWARVTPGSSFSRNDFKLDRRPDIDGHFNFLAVADVHFYGSQNYVSDATLDKFTATSVPELNSELASVAANGYDTFVISMGDLVTNFTRQYSVLKNRLQQVKLGGKSVTLFNVIGNHDHANAGANDYESTADFCDAFGPTYYSFNIGKAHIVCLDNIMYTGLRSGGYGKEVYYDEGIDDRQYQWFLDDMNSVKDKANTLLIVCVHAPIRALTDSNFQGLRNQYPQFANVVVLSGHKHIQNHYCYGTAYTAKSGRVPEEFTINPLGGLWKANISKSGDPNGYYVFTADGSNMPVHYFKATGRDRTYQLRVYDGSQVYHDPVTVGETEYKFQWGALTSSGATGPGKFIVKVFDADSDSRYVKVYLKKGDTNTSMKRVSVSGGMVDACASAYLYYNVEKNTAYLTPKQKNYWYATGSPSTEKNWSVEVQYTNSDGSVSTFSSSTLQSGYEGF